MAIAVFSVYNQATNYYPTFLFPMFFPSLFPSSLTTNTNWGWDIPTHYVGSNWNSWVVSTYLRWMLLQYHVIYHLRRRGFRDLMLLCRNHIRPSTLDAYARSTPQSTVFYVFLVHKRLTVLENIHIDFMCISLARAVRRVVARNETVPNALQK